MDNDCSNLSLGPYGLNKFSDGAGGGSPPVVSSGFRFLDNCFVSEPVAYIRFTPGRLVALRRRACRGACGQARWSDAPLR